MLRITRLRDSRRDLIAKMDPTDGALAGRLKVVEKELLRRDLRELPTVELLSAADSLRRRIEREAASLEAVFAKTDENGLNSLLFPAGSEEYN
ncbi:MAG: hypothetical protein ACXWIU_03405 [Limisphaerales bacterium]